MASLAADDMADLIFLSDTELLDKYSQGSEGAFFALERRYRLVLLSFILRFVYNKEIAEDIFQDVMLRLFQNRHKMRKGEPIIHWLFKVAQVRAADYIREQIKQTKLLNSDKFQQYINEPTNLKEHSYNELDINTEVKKVFRNLSEISKQVLILRFFMGRTYNEIANELNISLGTVKSRIYLAKKYFKKELQSTRSI